MRRDHVPNGRDGRRAAEIAAIAQPMSAPIAQAFDGQQERRRELVSARVIKAIPRIAGTPIVENDVQPSLSDERGDVIGRQIGQP